MTNRLKKDIHWTEGWTNVDVELYNKLKYERIRSERVTFVLTPTEKKIMQENALKGGYTNISDYIRDIIL